MIATYTSIASSRPRLEDIAAAIKRHCSQRVVGQMVKTDGVVWGKWLVWWKERNDYLLEARAAAIARERESSNQPPHAEEGPAPY